MKKYLVVIFSLLFIFVMTACHKQPENTNSSIGGTSQETNKNTVVSEENESDDSNKNSASSSSQFNINTSSENLMTENESNDDSSSDCVTITENNSFDTPIDPEDKYLLKNNHTRLNKEKYYQYSFLNDVEKEVYRRLRVAVLSYDRVIEVSYIDISNSRKEEIVECFMADNPQYFWVSGSYGLSRRGDITLSFSDGEIKDNTGFGNADSLKIDARRKTFNQVVFDIVSSINPNASEYEKELAIHDYITQTTKYDRKAEANPFANGVMDSAYDAYGVIVEKRGVCNGYADAFQYLCYMVGINSNVVFGNAHVWNTVQIEGEWYQVDVTWDDPIKSDGSSGDGNHNYFNLTSAQMYKIHSLSTESVYQCIKVPNCTATKNSYH
jgi:transglutaminase/protease-like cytokinesis protein 3